MIDLIGYRTVESIGGNDAIKIYRLLRLEDNQSVIAKTTSEQYPGTDMIAAFQHEYEVLQRLGGRGAIEPYSLEIMSGRPILIAQDIGGSTLNQLILTRPYTFGLPELLGVAAAISDCVVQLHREQITHHELTPFHFMVNPNSLEVKFVDLRMCSTIYGKSPLSLQASRSGFLLPYISPEHTGRTGTTPDYRSDFYSLGITLYEWLTGSLPFKMNDALDIVFRHLAGTPEPVHSKAPSMPKIVSDIVNKCMEKMPNARYASAFGIKSDLDECVARLQKSDEPKPFVLAGMDVPDQLNLSDSLYGREIEQLGLREALQWSSEGTAEIVWISGSGGIGKTFFVQETLRRHVSSKSFIAKGKFDPSPTALPYDFWVQVIGELADQLLMESELQAEVFKLRILNAVEGYGQLLIDLVPRLELLIGKQPPVQSLPAMEAQHRFYLIMNRFIQLFLDREQPLILFLDDLQWADEASLQYLAHLIDDQESVHLLLIGTYRDGEITAHHPLRRFEKQLGDRSARIRRIHLTALEAPDLKQMLSAAMRLEMDETDELATALLHKTEGNPFVVKQFLQDLVDCGQVSFNEENRCWQWDLQLIRARDVPDNTADYISDKLMHLHFRTGYVLGRAAFLGNQFDLVTLCSVTGFSEPELRETLGNAVRERLLQFVGETNKTYRFQHDRIHQAAYALVQEADREELHLSIGWLLAEQMNSSEAGNIFEVVNHLNQALDKIADPMQRLELAELNMKAGLKAKRSTAYETALAYFRNATALVEESYWNEYYELAFSSYNERAEAEFLCAHFDKANELLSMLLQKSITNIDKALVYVMMIQLEASNDNYAEVISLGQKALKLLDINHNFKPKRMDVMLLLLRLQWKLRKYKIGELRNLPPMTDVSRRIAMSVLVHIGNAFFVENKNGWVASSIKIMEMTLDYGLTPEASSGFVGYAMLLNFQFQQYEAANEWGQLACDVSKSNPALYVKALTSFSLCFDSWRQYDPSFLDTFTSQAGNMGLESGDLWQGNQSVMVNCSLQLKYGYPLNEIYDKLAAQSSSIKRNNNIMISKQATVIAALLCRLTGHHPLEDPFSMDDINKEDFAEMAHEDNTLFIKATLSLTQYMSCYLFGDYTKAAYYLSQAALFDKESKDDYFEKSTIYMYEVLIWAELYEEEEERTQKIYLSNMRNLMKKAEKYADKCPHNYRHSYLLIKATISRLTHKDYEAEELYEQAIEDGRKYGHIHNVGIAAECFAKYGLSRGKQRIAKVYMSEAYEAYLEWGAAAKATDLMDKYSNLLNIRRESDLERVDYLSVVMSIQALSGEMEMQRLLETLIRIMLRNAGAEFGALIFDHDGRWIIEASGTSEELAIHSISLEDAGDIIPLSIIGYSARTKEEVVLHDAAKEGMFVRNHYVKKKNLKSVLCLPIVHQNKLICLLYLENAQSPNLFTPERLNVLKLLCSQCAISIENARLYSGIQYLKNNLENQVEERTRSLERSMRETSAALSEMSVYAERNRIAQEIHDVVGHGLTSTILQIEAGKRLLSKDDTEGAIVRLQGAQDIVRHSLNEIRESVHMLKEGQFFNLPEAINQLIENSGVKVHAVVGDLPELSSDQKKVIYHALQEGITNGIRHGDSSEFRFRLEHAGSFLQFSLEDNGCGTDTIQIGFGLQAMKERVQQLGGNLHINSTIGKGCVLRFELPHSIYSMGDAEWTR